MRIPMGLVRGLRTISNFTTRKGDTVDWDGKLRQKCIGAIANFGWWFRNGAPGGGNSASGYALRSVAAAGSERRSTLNNAFFCLDKPNHFTII